MSLNRHPLVLTLDKELLKLKAIWMRFVDKPKMFLIRFKSNPKLLTKVSRHSKIQPKISGYLPMPEVKE